MNGVHDLALFVAAGLLLNVTPGADMALIGARSAQHGFRTGAAAALGVGAGCFVHVAAGALGLSALIAGSASAFTLLRWLGAAYLVWLGVTMLRSAGGDGSAPATDEHRTTAATGTVSVTNAAGAAAPAPPAPGARDAAAGALAISLRRAFAQGFLTNALNPKVALFFLAFLPQFIDRDAAHKALAFVALGSVFACNGTLVNVAFAALVARARDAFGSRPLLARWLTRGVGALFVALGIRLAVVDGGAG